MRHRFGAHEHEHRGHQHGGGGHEGGGGGYLPDVSLEALERFGVLPAATEIYKDSLYDSNPYPAAGSVALSFFANQIGQGVGLGGAAKTISDTNMELSGQLSQGTGFLIERIEVEFQPTTPSVTKDLPFFFGAAQSLQLGNDVYVFGRSGSLVFTGPNQKTFLIQGPMNRFPSMKNFEFDAAVADATTAGAAQQSRAGFARWAGEPYDMHPVPIWLDANMKFGIQLKWDEGVQALPSGNPARVFVRLVGLRVHLGPEYRRCAPGISGHAVHHRRMLHHHRG
jgi:hypothetical protein